jgi:hypothetical protein
MSYWVYDVVTQAADELDLMARNAGIRLEHRWADGMTSHSPAVTVARVGLPEAPADRLLAPHRRGQRDADLCRLSQAMLRHPLYRDEPENGTMCSG